MQVRVLGALAALLLLAGCPGGPTMGEVADSFAPRLQARHAELKKVVAGLPAPGSVTAPAAASGLTPAPEYKKKAGSFTLDILQVEHVEDPKVELRLVPGKLDLLASEVLLLPLRWTAPGGMSEGDRAHKAYELYPRQFEKALELRWVALVRTVEHAPPEAVNEAEFKGGHSRLEVFLVDLQDGSVKASFPVEAASKRDVAYEYRQGKDDPKERLTAFARSTLWEDARAKIADGLRRHAGAAVAFD